jgi:hypothetical protein
MAILSKGKKYSGVSSGHLCRRIEDTVFGPASYKIQKDMEYFSNDFIFTYIEAEHDDDNDGVNDKEVGIDKERGRFSSHDWNDEDKHRNRDRGVFRRFERMKGCF